MYTALALSFRGPTIYERPIGKTVCFQLFKFSDSEEEHTWCPKSHCALVRAYCSDCNHPDPRTLEKCAKGICLCNLLRSTQRNDRETVIEG